MQADAADGQQHLRPVGKLSLEAPAPTPSPESGAGRAASRAGGSPCPWGGSPHPERQEQSGAASQRPHQTVTRTRFTAALVQRVTSKFPALCRRENFLCFLGKTMPPPTTRAARSQRPASRRRPALHRRSPGLREAHGTQARRHGGRCQQALPRARQRAGAKTETVSGDGGTAVSPPSPATSWTAGS